MLVGTRHAVSCSYSLILSFRLNPSAASDFSFLCAILSKIKVKVVWELQIVIIFAILLSKS